MYSAAKRSLESPNKPENIEQIVIAHATSAMQGFLKCIEMRPDSCFSDLIQMISIFFSVNLDKDSFDKIKTKLDLLDDTMFLSIIPQLFTQLLVPKTNASEFAVHLIQKLLPQHYHVLLFPLLFEKTPNKVTLAIRNQFKKINNEAMSQAEIISNGLQLCSCSTLEIWYDYISDAINALSKGKEFMKDKFDNAIQKALALEKREDDNRQIKMIRKQLKEIDLKREKMGSNEEIQNSVQTHLKKLHSEISRYLSGINVLFMHSISLDLALLRDSCIAVPGTYDPDSDQPVVEIKFFDPNIEIYHSKQRPRLIVIFGNDGSKHRSLLKGRVDVRLDQRIMQFFGLINQHLSHGFHDESHSVGLKIFRYSINPLSKDCGLIQFVDGADTMYSLISNYRQKKNIPVSQEQEVMQTFFQQKTFSTTSKATIGFNINSLRPIQRNELYLDLIQMIPDIDLREVIWLTSLSSYKWAFRSIRFTQSNALMSIIGYILGLGDRHPNNLMIHRDSGSIIHIDFSDCFEIAKNRVLFTELVPFRLTRMMVRAFGPNGIEGEFRSTCEETLKMVRLHRHSIMAVLEIFLKEPLREVNSKVDEKVIDMNEAMNELMNKIKGSEYETISDQVDDLIVSATDIYNLSYLYQGWTPLW
ncbi:PIKK family atypical protein kinase [Histomonas meleagridis]|uniref:PIKK family atypical protein kinase n=1 Tax=Histomonas meleagridis TaxID=135588 RepID=UPI00355A647D|nr:PIKK family atypical protein kinase [Histomonas meleagridis]KAH0806837.1 PIKK family atypical protein kinase [Histomonas meleagridis]